MAFKDNLSPLHGYRVRGLNRPSQEANTAFIDAIQKELTTGEQQMYQARLEAFLDTSEGEWLDYWGQWLGLHREGRNDDIYRNALKQHVLHKRNTITAIREALASYLKTEIDNIYIYEPWRDMFVYNSSKWNTYKFYPSTYYRYAVIDVQIDAPFNRSIAKLINLFRPAGVYWVITSLVNVLNKKAPIVDFTIDTEFHFISDDIDYVGFLQRHNNSITPDFHFSLDINNPFIYNNSFLNGGRVYYQVRNSNQGIASLAPMYQADTQPKAEDSRETAFSYIQPLQYGDTSLLSRVDGRGVDYSFIAKNANLATGITKDNNTYYITADWINYQAKTNDNLFIYGQRAVQTYTSEIHKYKVRLPKGTYTFSVIPQQVTFPFKLYVHVLSDAVNKDHDLSSNVFPANSQQRVSTTFTLDNNATVELSPIYTDDVNTMGEYKYSQVQLQQGNVATNEIVYQTPKAYLLGIHTQNDSEVILHAMNDKTGLMTFYVDQENRENFDTNGRNWHIYRLPQDCVSTDISFETPDQVLDTTLIPFDEQATLNPMPFRVGSLKPAPLMGFIDFYDYYQRGQLMGENKKDSVLNEINDSPIKNLTVYMRDNMGSQQQVTAYVYDFSIKMWVNLAKFNVTANYQVFKIGFISLEHYINDNGVLFVKFVPESYNHNLAVDYFGFNYGKNEFKIFDSYVDQKPYGWQTDDTTGTSVIPKVGSAKVDVSKLISADQKMLTVFLQHKLTNNTNLIDRTLVPGDILVITAGQAEPGNSFHYANVYDGDLVANQSVIVTLTKNAPNNFMVDHTKVKDLSIVLITRHVDGAGVNLLNGTNNFSFPYSLTRVNQASPDQDAQAIHLKESAKNAQQSAMLTFTIGGQENDQLEINREFAFSVELTGTGKLSQFGFTGADKDMNTDLTLNPHYWQRYEYTGTKTKNGQFVLAFDLVNNQDLDIEIRKIKVEYGKTSTVYTASDTPGRIIPPTISGQVSLVVQMIDQDDNNKILRTDNRSGFAGDSVSFDFSSWLPDNTHWVSQPANDYVLSSSNATIQIPIKHDVQVIKGFIMNTVTRTINITEPAKQLQTTTDKFVFTRDGLKDRYTGKSGLSDWNVASHHFDPVTIPGVDGYTPQVTGNAGAIDITPTTESWTVNITYTKNS